MLHAEGLGGATGRGGLPHLQHLHEKADSRLVGHLGTARRLKTRDSGVVVVAAGCLAQSRGEDPLREQACVDVLVGPQDIACSLRSCAEDWRKDAGERTGSHHHGVRCRSAARAARRTARLGADHDRMHQLRSYCVVPLVRGRKRPGPRTTSSPRCRGWWQTVCAKPCWGRTSMPGGRSGSTARTISPIFSAR